jgi:putative lipoic acid-binding regulatory protein
MQCNENEMYNIKVIMVVLSSVADKALHIVRNCAFMRETPEYRVRYSSSFSTSSTVLVLKMLEIEIYRTRYKSLAHRRESREIKFNSFLFFFFILFYFFIHFSCSNLFAVVINKYEFGYRSAIVISLFVFISTTHSGAVIIGL